MLMVHINPINIHLERITRNDKKLVNDLIMMELGFLFHKKILARLKRKTAFALMYFVMEISWFFESTIQIKNLKARWICCF